MLLRVQCIIHISKFKKPIKIELTDKPFVTVIDSCNEPKNLKFKKNESSFKISIFFLYLDRINFPPTTPVIGNISFSGALEGKSPQGFLSA